MNRLKNIDKVAYVRFASVYLDFKDVREFMAELKELLDTKETASAKAKSGELPSSKLPDEWFCISAPFGCAQAGYFRRPQVAPILLWASVSV